jgi:hypothetical protein
MKYDYCLKINKYGKKNLLNKQQQHRRLDEREKKKKINQ